MGISMGIIEGLGNILSGLLILITITMYLLTIRKKAKVIKPIILIFGFLSAIILMILIATKNSKQEIEEVLTSSVLFCAATFFGLKGMESSEKIDPIIKKQKNFKKITYNIKGKKLNEKDLEKIKDNLYNYFRFFEFNSYDAKIGKIKIDIEKVSDKIIQIDVDHILSDESEIYYYDIVSRYESLKNSSFIDEVYLKYDSKFSNKIKLITRIIME